MGNNETDTELINFHLPELPEIGVSENVLGRVPLFRVIFTHTDNDILILLGSMWQQDLNASTLLWRKVEIHTSCFAAAKIAKVPIY